MKIIIPIIFLLFSKFSLCQTAEVELLLNETKNTNLDMWDLAEFVSKKLKSKEKSANFFYHWIGRNISYDKDGLAKVKNGIIDSDEFYSNQDEYNVYENRKAVCAGYANLYKWFMDELEIEAVIISGYIRDPRNHYIELNSDSSFRHGWNAIKLDNEWKLVDTTWGNSNDPEQSEYFYDINPKWLIITHYPEDSNWQLLEKPLTLEEFNNSKYKSQCGFILDFWKHQNYWRMTIIITLHLMIMKQIGRLNYNIALTI